MISRRDMGLGLGMVLTTPMIGRAQTPLEQAANALPQLHAIIVQRGDVQVLAHAPRGPGLARPANIKSCSKSLLSLLVGAAIAQGAIPGVSARLGDIAPRLVPPDATEGAAALSIDNLLTMRTGLAGTSGANYGAWVESRNWISYVLRQPRIGPPGAQMTYSTGTTHVLGAALTTATGDSLLTLSRRWLGEDLGIQIAPWTRDPQGFYFGGNEMALTPQAMLRIAIMMRDGGRYDGRQVITPDWVRAATRPHTRSPYSGLAYGYGWFLSPSGWHLARGYGGQIIAAHPGRALAVAITSDPTQPARSEGYFGDLMRLLDGPILGLA